MRFSTDGGVLDFGIPSSLSDSEFHLTGRMVFEFH
jgi:hypothetical protein